ncbi:unnamed protein product [Musa acuminata subsp. malaccensis]|uniref:(wild Malaysian banana) hypothetical protein n=1 Tax=Musa acuminata subsp. malaccensis TaxID=214687 RepID=A0A8D7FJZ6_MUSAM|nr:unnamed protein product [Musa acuminata subsp. malaccensis]
MKLGHGECSWDIINLFQVCSILDCRTVALHTTLACYALKRVDYGNHVYLPIIFLSVFILVISSQYGCKILISICSLNSFRN